MLIFYHLQDLQELGTRGPLRASTANSIVMRKSSDSSSDDAQSPALNGNGGLQSSPASNRLENSFLFSSYRSSSIDQPLENGKTHLPLFRTGSLPDTGLSNDRMSTGPKELGDLNGGTDPAGNRFERYSFLLNSASSSSSLTGVDDLNARMSQPPSMSIGSSSPSRLLSPTGSIDLHRPSFTATDSPLSMFGQTTGMGVGTGTLGTPILQRSLSSDATMGVQSPLFGSMHGGPQFQSQEPDRNVVSKYRAFPDAYVSITVCTTH